MTSIGDYQIPEHQLSLSGPVARPETGTLPIRGDLAHIALASHYLCAHYVVPQQRRIGTADVELRCHPRANSDPIITLSAGSAFEALDYAGDWCWGCCGPQGPTGYLPIAQLEP